jgi:hypothetical protein
MLERKREREREREYPEEGGALTSVAGEGRRKEKNGRVSRQRK